MEEDEYKKIVNFLNFGTYPNLKKDDKRNFRRKCKRFRTSGESLYYNGDKLVVKKGDTRKIIENLHSSEHGGGHLGIHKT